MFAEWADLKWIARCLACSFDGLPQPKMLFLVGFTISMFSLRCWIAELECFMPPLMAAAVPGLFFLI